MFTRLVLWYRKYQRKRRQIATFSTLELLPAELKHEIASWLPLHSKASLALCSSTLYNTFCFKILSRLKADESERPEFLQLLDRDLSNTLYCYSCHRLHVIYPEQLSHHTRTKTILWRINRWRCHDNPFFRLCIGRKMFSLAFSFDHIRMATKLHRLGLQSQAQAYLRYLSYSEPLVREMSSSPMFRGFYFLEFCFIKDQIYARAQSWAPIGLAREEGICQRATAVCAHNQARSVYLTSGLDVENKYQEEIRCRLKRLRSNRQDCEQCGCLKRCSFCPTEFCIEVRGAGDDFEDNFLVITKWHILEFGLLPSKDELRAIYPVRPQPWQYAADSLLGGIRNKFEAQAKISYKDLLSAPRARHIFCETSSSKRL